MTQKRLEDVLFPDDIIPWDEMVKLVIILRIPFRHRAKGIECITGGYIASPSISCHRVEWFTATLSQNNRQFIKEHLHELPSLEFPVPLGIANDFVDKFILLKDSPNIVPSFLTIMSLDSDQQERSSLFTSEKEELQQLVLNRDVFLIDASLNKCEHLTHGVYFSKREAIQFLDKKGLLDRAIAADCSWRDQIREPEVGGLSQPTEDSYYGLPQELIGMGIQDYRRTLTLRKLEVIASQISQSHHVLVKKSQVVEENSAERHAPEPVKELVSGGVESRPNLVVDEVQEMQISSLFTAGNKNVKSSSSEHFAVSENDESKPKKAKPVTESEMILDSEIDPARVRLIGMKEVMERLGVSRPTIYNYLNPDSPSYNPNFPQPLKLNSENKWVESKIIAFVEALNSSKKKRGTKQNR